VRLLLDTHVALWLITDDVKLSAAVRKNIIAAGDQVYVSAASILEVSIKHKLQPNLMPVSGKRAMEQFLAAGLQMLPVSAEHAAQVDELPLHHRDPFDRLLIAQAICEPLRLLTRDAQLTIYSELVMLV
jgi:PIN domain nuclease of toxin-antitoxin system